MANVSYKYRVVANKPYLDLFNHIIALLDNEDINNTPVMPSFETITSKFPTRSPPRKINPKSLTETRDNWDEAGDSDEETISIQDDFNPNRSPKDKSLPYLRRAQTKPNKKRKNIPSKVRQMTWRQYIGNVLDGKCWCCDDDISI